MSHWRFELAKSSDLSVIGELDQARGRSLSLALNRAGSCSFALPIEDEFTDEINEISTCVLIRHHSDIVWSGPIWQIEESTPNTVNVSAVGWLQTLERRHTRPSWGNPLIYNNQDGSVIAYDLLKRSNDAATELGSPIYVKQGTGQASAARDRSYQPYSQILSSITELSEIESGYDLHVDPVTRELNIYSKRQTTRETYFEYGVNVASVQRASDASRVCNRFTAYSTYGSAVAQDNASITSYGLLEESLSLSDVPDVALLQAYANAEIAVRSTPLRIAGFTPMPETPTTPTPFDDFDIGDIVYLTAKKGRLQLDRQAVRIFGFDLSWTEVGVAHISQIRTTAS